MRVIQLANGLFNSHYVGGNKALFKALGLERWKKSPRLSFMKITFFFVKEIQTMKNKYKLRPEMINGYR